MPRTNHQQWEFLCWWCSLSSCTPRDLSDHPHWPFVKTSNASDAGAGASSLEPGPGEPEPGTARRPKQVGGEDPCWNSPGRKLFCVSTQTHTHLYQATKNLCLRCQHMVYQTTSRESTHRFPGPNDGSIGRVAPVVPSWNTKGLQQIKIQEQELLGIPNTTHVGRIRWEGGGGGGFRKTTKEIIQSQRCGDRYFPDDVFWLQRRMKVDFFQTG